MVKTNIVLKKYLQQNSLSKNTREINAAANIQTLLSELDLTAEVVPESSFDMLSRLLTSLKGEPLNTEEVKIVDEIINY